MLRTSSVEKKNTAAMIAKYLEKGYSKFLLDRPLTVNFVDGSYRWFTVLPHASFDSTDLKAITSSDDKMREFFGGH